MRDYIYTRVCRNKSRIESIPQVCDFHFFMYEEGQQEYCLSMIVSQKLYILFM